jgi:hypothetical protein
VATKSLCNLDNARVKIQMIRKIILSRHLQRRKIVDLIYVYIFKKCLLCEVALSLIDLALAFFVIIIKDDLLELM